MIKNWIITNFTDYGTYKEQHEHINRIILDGNVINMSLVILESNHVAIYADYSTCNGYYIIKFY